MPLADGWSHRAGGRQGGRKSKWITASIVSFILGQGSALASYTGGVGGSTKPFAFIEAKVSSVKDPAAPTSWRSRLKGGLPDESVRPQHLGEGSAPLGGQRRRHRGPARCPRPHSQLHHLLDTFYLHVVLDQLRALGPQVGLPYEWNGNFTRENRRSTVGGAAGVMLRSSRTHHQRALTTSVAVIPVS